MANKNFEVTNTQDWGSEIVADIRVLDKEYRYHLPNKGWIQKLLSKKRFLAKDLEEIEKNATEYERLR